MSRNNDNKNSNRKSEVANLLDQWRRGDAAAPEVLLTMLYSDLRKLAAGYLRKERPNHTLQPTALLNEAYIRISGRMRIPVESRAHFMAAAAEAMRHILIDHARRKARQKRGGDRQRITLCDNVAGSDAVDVDLLALDQALDRLQQRDERMAEVVKLRYFAGLSIDDTAKVLESSPRSVNRHWTAARAWLRRELSSADAAAKPDRHV